MCEKVAGNLTSPPKPGRLIYERGVWLILETPLLIMVDVFIHVY